MIGDRYSIEQQAPFGENLTDGQIKTHCFDGAHAWCWAREAYFEAKMGDTQLRIGKQQVVWGKTDAFRLQDLVNPIDFGQHNVYPSLEDRRIPTLSADLVHSFGNVGPARGRLARARLGVRQIHPGAGRAVRRLLGVHGGLRRRASTRARTVS